MIRLCEAFISNIPYSDMIPFLITFEWQKMNNLVKEIHLSTIIDVPKIQSHILV